MSQEVEKVIKSQLPKNMSAKRANALAEQIADALAEAGLLLDEHCTAVEVGDALLPVQTIESYGLVIKLDANGDASEISSRAGLVVIG